MSGRIYNVLFLCTVNSARSILAESSMNGLGRTRFHAYSAGSFPTGRVRPEAIALLRSLNLPTEGLRSKSWDEFAAPGAPQMDFIFTVCDNAAGEACPVWPGEPVTAHWGVADPAAAAGSDVEIMSAFREAFRILDMRVKLFSSPRLEGLNRLATEREARRIGRAEADSLAGAQA